MGVDVSRPVSGWKVVFGLVAAVLVLLLLVAWPFVSLWLFFPRDEDAFEGPVATQPAGTLKPWRSFPAW